jgi:uncharacterized repeat protein (TIGR02543 family)
MFILKRSKFWALVLTVTMVFSLLPVFPPTTVHAASADANIDLNDDSPPALGAGWIYEDSTKVFTILDGADVTVTGTTNTKRIVVEHSTQYYAQATVRLNGASIDVSDITNTCAFDTANADVTLILTGINTLKSNGDAAGLHVGPNAKLTVTGSTGDGSETGTLNVNGGAKAAGIGGNSGEAGGSITINGGTINATGSTNAGANGGGAGIGGGYQGDGGFITINGGKVEATVGSNDWGAAAIGGGGSDTNNTTSDGGEAGTIVINGGTVIATGPAYSAGIGCGYTPKNKNGNGKITINGGNVTATSLACGAGIGGGGLGAGGNITINGGIVTAYTGGGAGDPAAIGGAWQQGAGAITITGGVVVAIAGGGGAFSGGNDQTDGSITISGGTVVGTGYGIGLGAGNGKIKTTISGNPVIFATAINGSFTQDGVAYGAANVSIVTSGTPLGKMGTLTLNTNFTVPVGATLIIPPGWTLDLGSYTLTNSGTIIKYDTGAITITLPYDGITPHTVAFNMHGRGTAPVGFDISNGGTLPEPPNPVAEGYIFGGWYKEANYTTPWNFPSDTVTADTILHAKWTANPSLPSKPPLPSVAPGYKDFGAAPVGYDNTAFAQQFTITNPGTAQMTDVTAAIVDESGNESFEIVPSSLSANTIDAQGNVTVSVQPASGLATSATLYRGKLRVTANNNALSLNIPLAITVAASITAITLEAGTDGTDGSATATPGGVLSNITAPTRAGYTLEGYYKEDTCTNKVANSAGTLLTTVSGFTDGDGKWINTEATATLYAKWTVKSAYTVNYELNGGLYNDSATNPSAKSNVKWTDANLLPDGETYDAAKMTKTGYTFNGWNVTTGGPASPQTNVANTHKYSDLAAADDTTTSITLTAQWTANAATDYTVKHYQQNLADGATYTLIDGDTDTKQGTTGGAADFTSKTYSGFSYASTKTTYEDTDHTTPSTTALPIAADGSLVISLYYDRNSYTLSYANGSHGTVTTTSESVDYQAAPVVSCTQTPSAGYTFDGWKLDKSVTATGSVAEIIAGNSIAANTKMTTAELRTVQMPSENVTASAQWAAKNVAVTYNANGGTGLAGESTSGDYDGTLTAPTTNPTKTGYTFNGWYWTDTFAEATNFTFGGSGTTLTTAHGVIGADGITPSLTLYAKWTANTYTIAFDANNANATGSMSNIAKTYGTDASLTTNGFSLAGHTFAGWAETPDGAVVYADSATLTEDLATTQGGTVTLYAQWTANTYTIAFDGNNDGATGSTSSIAKTYGTNATLTANGFSLTGHTFAGWATTPDGDVAYDDNAAVTSDLTTAQGATVTLYAKWTANKTAITLNPNGGTGGTGIVTATYDSSVLAPSTFTAPTRTGYTLTGYFTAASGGTKVITEAGTLVANASGYTDATGKWAREGAAVTLYVQWTAETNPDGGGGGGGGGGSDTTTYYTITYNANGGAGGRLVSGISYYGKHTVLTQTAADVRHGGYTFDGWNTRANGRGTSYTPGDSITVTGTITLYAQWTLTGGNNSSSGNLVGTQKHIAYLTGYPDGTIGADNAITRAEAAAIFYRLLDDPGTVESSRFSDIAGDEWYADEVACLASLGLLTGYPDGTFKPDAPITRAEVAAIASRFGALASTSGNAFSDVPSSHWAASFVNSAYEEGWVGGYPDGTFRPEDSATRAEVVKIANAMLERRPDADALARIVNPYNDLSVSHWAYPDILEASLTHEYVRQADGSENWT